jgi:hypothetical protein
MDQELKQCLDANFARIDEKFAEVEKDIGARLAKVETSLLGAFYGWARPMEVRVSGISTMVLGFDERLALAERAFPN